LTEPQLDAIIAGGAEVDEKFQQAENSFMHSMRDGKTPQSVSEAMQARNEWVRNQITNFQESGDYKYLGYAIHAMSDEHASTHSWKPWYGQSKWNPSSWVHFAGELNPFGSYNRGFKLSEILVMKTYLSATTNPPSSSNLTPTLPPTPGPTPVPVPPAPTVTPPFTPPGLIPPTPPPPTPTIGPIRPPDWK